MSTKSKPRDQQLYDSIADDIRSRYKPSAYRSGLLVQEYKRAYEQKHHSTDAYTGTKSKKKGLGRWFAENWTNQRGTVGYQSKSDVYRPNVRITAKTPATFSELTPAQISSARREKRTKGRVKRFND